MTLPERRGIITGKWSYGPLHLPNKRDLIVYDTNETNKEVCSFGIGKQREFPSASISSVMCPHHHGEWEEGQG